MAFNTSRNKVVWRILLLSVVSGIWASSILSIQGDLMRQEYEKVVTTPFHYGNDTEQTRVLTSSVAVANEAFIEVYCHLYASSTNNITLLFDPDYWNLTTIPVSIGETINVTVTNGNLDLDADVAAKLQVFVLRASAGDEVQGMLILNVITKGWKKTSWEGIVGLGVLFLIALMKRANKKSG